MHHTIALQIPAPLDESCDLVLFIIVVLIVMMNIMYSFMRHIYPCRLLDDDLYFPFSSPFEFYLASFWRLLGLSFMEKNKKKREMIDISMYMQTVNG